MHYDANSFSFQPVGASKWQWASQIENYAKKINFLHISNQSRLICNSANNINGGILRHSQRQFRMYFSFSLVHPSLELTRRFIYVTSTSDLGRELTERLYRAWRCFPISSFSIHWPINSSLSWPDISVLSASLVLSPPSQHCCVATQTGDNLL